MKAWQKKLVGQQYRDGIFYNILDSGVSSARVFVKGQVKSWLDGYKDTLRNSKPVASKSIYGKKFVVPKSIFSTPVKWGTTKVVNIVEDMAINFLDNKWQCNTGKGIANDLKNVAPDRELLRKLHDETGYEFEPERFMKEFKEQLSGDPISRYNENWRKHMPNILKDAYAHELKRMFDTMNRTAQEGDMMHSRDLHEATMKNAMGILGQVFENLGEQIAVNTDVLDVPPRFIADPKLDEEEVPKEGELSAKEKEIWDARKVSRPGLTTKEELDKALSDAMGAYEEADADKMFENFKKKIFRPNDDGTTYNAKIDKKADMARIMQAGYAMRELNKRLDGYSEDYKKEHPDVVEKEQEVLGKMKNVLETVYDYKGKRLDNLADHTLSFNKVMTTPEFVKKAAGIIPYPPDPTTGEKVLEATKYYGSKAAKITWDLTKKTASTTLNVVTKGAGMVWDLTKKTGSFLYNTVAGPKKEEEPIKLELDESDLPGFERDDTGNESEVKEDNKNAEIKAEENKVQENKVQENKAENDWEVIEKENAPTPRQAHILTPEEKELEAAPKGKPEDWQLKLMGRKNIGFQIINGEIIDDVKVYVKAKIGKYSKAFIDNRRDYSKLKAKNIYGKNYGGESDGLKDHAITWGLAKAMPFAEAYANDFLDGKYKCGTGQAIANDVSSCEPDYGLVTDLYNATGYKFDSKRFMQEFKENLANEPASHYYEEWREKIMPEVMKLAFEKEMNTMLTSMAEQADKCPGMKSRELARDNMALAAKMLGGVFENFSTQIANKTDCLKIPPRMFSDPEKDKEVLPRDSYQTVDERKRWKEQNIKRPGLTTPKAVNKAIDKAMKGVKELSSVELMDTFNKNLFSRIDGKQYVIGENPEVDNVRKMQAILTMRELKSKIESAGLMDKMFRGSKLNQDKAALSEMKEIFTSVYDMDKGSMEEYLDLRQKVADPANTRELLGLPHEHKKDTIELFKDSIKEKAANVGEKITDVADNIAVKLENLIEDLMDYFDGPSETEESIKQQKEEARKALQDKQSKADVVIVDGEIFSAMDDEIDNVEEAEAKAMEESDEDEDVFEDAAENEEELAEKIEEVKQSKLEQQKNLSKDIDSKINESTEKYYENLKKEYDDAEDFGDEFNSSDTARKMLAGKLYLMFIKTKVMNSKAKDPMHDPNLPLDTLLDEKMIDEMASRTMRAPGFEETANSYKNYEIAAMGMGDYKSTNLEKFHIAMNENSKKAAKLQSDPQKVQSKVKESDVKENTHSNVQKEDSGKSLG